MGKDFLSNNEDISKILGRIGMSDGEKIIYIELLKMGESTALEIAKNTTIHRTNVYDLLRKLIARGFVKESLGEEKKKFMALEPNKIKNYIEDMGRRLETVLPQLNELASKKSEDHINKVSITKGTFAAREALTSLLEKGETIYAFGASDAAIRGFGEGFLEEFHKKRIAKKIMMKHIYSPHAEERIKKLRKMKYTQAKKSQIENDSLAATCICKDTLVIFVWSNPILVLSITNKEVADSYLDQFEVLWKLNIPKNKQKL